MWLAEQQAGGVDCSLPAIVIRGFFQDEGRMAQGGYQQELLVVGGAVIPHPNTKPTAVNAVATWWP
jgi:hypothetical protein